MLAHLRQSRLLTQADLANAVGISSGFLSLVESGTRGCSIEVLHRIAEALELDAIHRSELLGWAAQQAESRRSAA